MQLKTVLKGSPHSWMPSFGHLYIYSSPRVTLVHLAANAIRLGLHVTGQDVPQKLIRLGNCLVVSLLSMSWVCPVSNLWDSISSLGTLPLVPAFFWRFSSVLTSLSTTLASFLHCTLSPFWLMRRRTAMACKRYSLVFPWEKMDMLKMFPLGSLILRLSGASFVVTRSVGGMYRMGGQLLICPFLHSKSFSPLGPFENGTHLGMLPECGTQHKSLERRSWWTHRNQTVCVVAWKKLCREQKSWLQNSCYCQLCTYSWLN